MTTKEISTLIGKDERSVRRWVAILADKMTVVKDKMTVSSPMKPADWDVEETLAIIKQGLGQDVANAYRTLITQQTVQETSSTLTKRDMELIAGIVTMVMQNMETRVSTIEKRVESRQALLPPPDVSPRDNINRIVREYANREEEEFSTVWKMLYREYGYRMKCNPVTKANNRNMKVIDLIESEGNLGMLESIAITLLGK